MSRYPNEWILWEEPEGGGIFTRDHVDPTFAYMGYKFAVLELYELLNSIHLAWDYCFKAPATDYVRYVGQHLLDTGRITPSSSRSDVHHEFQRLSPEATRHILYAQIMASGVSAYLTYLKTTLSFALPTHFKDYPKRFKVDLASTSDAHSIDDFVVRSLLPEIEAIGYFDYPSLKERFYALGVYPSRSNRDLQLIEKYIRKRNEILHFHPGSSFVETGYLRDTSKINERTLFASLKAFTRVVNWIELRAMKRFRMWSGFRMIEAYASSSENWPHSDR